MCGFLESGWTSVEKGKKGGGGGGAIYNRGEGEFKRRLSLLLNPFKIFFLRVSPMSDRQTASLPLPKKEVMGEKRWWGSRVFL